MRGTPVASESQARTREQAGRSKGRMLAEFLLVALFTVGLIVALGSICYGLLSPHASGTRDFVEYWAAGQQLAHHANPYAASATLALERSAGFPLKLPALVMGNPPPALLLVIPLGYLGDKAAAFLWVLFLASCLIMSIRNIGQMHGGARSRVQLIGYTFGPALVCLDVGQLSILVLFGLTVFLRFHRERPFLAGAALWFCALKPQLFLPFGLVLLVWVVRSRAYKLLSGAIVALLSSLVLIHSLDPSAWSQYHQMMTELRYDRLPIPCWSIFFREHISPSTMWLQYVPAGLSSLWALDYFRRNRHHWDWKTNGSPLILVSVLVAPYTWFIDQVVVLPALLEGAYANESGIGLAVLASATAVIELGPLRGLSVLHSNFYLWTAPGWLAWYLYTKRHTRKQELSALPSGAEANGVADKLRIADLRGI